MPDAVVRAARPSDAERITEVWVQSWLDTYPNHTLGVTEEWLRERVAWRGSPEGVAALRAILERGASAERASFVADVDGRVVGLAAPHVDRSGRQRVGALYVDPSSEPASSGRGRLTDADVVPKRRCCSQKPTMHARHPVAASVAVANLG